MNLQRVTNNWPIIVLVGVVTLVNLVILVLINDDLAGDQLRYVESAERLLNGQIVDDDGEIANGPTLPGFVALGMKVGLPLVVMKMFSIVFVCAVVVMLFYTVRSLSTTPVAFVVALLFAIHPGFLWLGSQIMTEPMGSFLLCAACCLAMRPAQGVIANCLHVFLLSLLFGILILLKSLFAYAFIFMGVVGLLASLFLPKIWRVVWMRIGVAALVSFIWCVPYLSITYDEYNKPFYWVTTGGSLLYAMTVGGEDQWGNWIDPTRVDELYGGAQQEIANEFKALSTLPAHQRDQQFRQVAIERISNDPVTYLRNLVANAGRVLFNYPYSNRPQSLFTYGYILPNMVLYFALILSFVAWRYTKLAANPALAWFVLLGLVFVGGNVFVASSVRHGLVVLAIFLIWILSQWRLVVDSGIVSIPKKKVV